jgi:hypothetical protein
MSRRKIKKPQERQIKRYLFKKNWMNKKAWQEFCQKNHKKIKAAVKSVLKANEK